MAFIEWSSALALNVAAMDGEHKELIAYMNRLHDLNEQNAPKDAIVAAFKNLAEFTIKHFSDEEAYMSSINFPDLELHKYIHKDLLTKVSKHFEDFKAGDGKLDRKVFDFLNIWLKAHIMGLDSKYAEHSRAKAS